MSLTNQSTGAFALDHELKLKEHPQTGLSLSAAIPMSAKARSLIH